MCGSGGGSVVERAVVVQIPGVREGAAAGVGRECGGESDGGGLVAKVGAIGVGYGGRVGNGESGGVCHAGVGHCDCPGTVLFGGVDVGCPRSPSARCDSIDCVRRDVPIVAIGICSGAGVGNGLTCTDSCGCRCEGEADRAGMSDRERGGAGAGVVTTRDSPRSGQLGCVSVSRPGSSGVGSVRIGAMGCDIPSVAVAAVSSDSVGDGLPGADDCAGGGQRDDGGGLDRSGHAACLGITLIAVNGGAVGDDCPVAQRTGDGDEQSNIARCGGGQAADIPVEGVARSYGRCK